jgi:hypothetical protein
MFEDAMEASRMKKDPIKEIVDHETAETVERDRAREKAIKADPKKVRRFLKALLG